MQFALTFGLIGEITSNLQDSATRTGSAKTFLITPTFLTVAFSPLHSLTGIMSWLARSLANSLRLDDDDGGDDDADSENDVAPNTPYDPSPAKCIQEESVERTEIQDEGDETQTRGVKEDLSELKQTLTRQLWGVATFLAPAPTSNDRPPSNLNQFEASDRSNEADHSDSEEVSGIRQDFTEIGGRFRSGVTEISKMATNYLPFGSEENEVENDEGNETHGEELEIEEPDDWGPEAIGITDEVLAFARNIAMHPETWLDFPLDEEDDLDGASIFLNFYVHMLILEISYLFVLLNLFVVEVLKQPNVPHLHLSHAFF